MECGMPEPCECQSDRQTGKHTSRQAGRETARHADTQTDRGTQKKRALPTCRYQKRKVKMRPMPKPMNQATKRTDRYW